MSSPFDYFDQIYCIHLPNCKDRYELMQQQFTSVGIDPKRVNYISATPPPKGFAISNMQGRGAIGNMGVNLSQIKAIVHAATSGAKRPLFFEDDIIFRPDTGEVLTKALDELPEDWDVLYMGGHPRGKAINRPAYMHSEHLARVSQHAFADAYSIQGRLLTDLFDTWLDKISQPKAMWDFILGDWIEPYEAYCVYPLPCEQRPGKSIISGQEENKYDLVLRGWMGHIGQDAIKHLNPKAQNDAIRIYNQKRGKRPPFSKGK